MTQLQAWFKKGYFTDKYIGVCEWNGNRILINDNDTIETIERALKTLRAYALQ